MSTQKVIAVCGTFDTKGQELLCLSEEIKSMGFSVVLIDMSTRISGCTVDYTADDALLADGKNPVQARKELEASELFAAISCGAGKLTLELIRAENLHGVISMAGGRGTFMACGLLRQLPVGFPKVLISTIATSEGIQHTFAGINDTMVINPLVDVSGLNPILRMAIKEGAAAVCGMVGAGCTLEAGTGQVRIGITMWGVTTPCVEHVRQRLEAEGYEVYVFHANGLGGAMMDKLVEQGYLHVVADLTLSEITQPVCRGEFAERNAVNRMKVACEKGIPQVVTFGGIDMVYWGTHTPETVDSRKKYWHTEDCVFHRSNADEVRRCVRWVADRLNTSNGKVTVLLPLQGTSAVDRAGAVLYEPETDRELFRAAHEDMGPNVEVIDVDAHINDAAFADAVTDQLLCYASEIKETMKQK